MRAVRPEWKVFEQSAAVPEDASSAFCRFGFGPALLPFTGELDRLFVSGEALLFADGLRIGRYLDLVVGRALKRPAIFLAR